MPWKTWDKEKEPQNLGQGAPFSKGGVHLLTEAAPILSEPLGRNA